MGTPLDLGSSSDPSHQSEAKQIMSINVVGFFSKKETGKKMSWWSDLEAVPVLAAVPSSTV